MSGFSVPHAAHFFTARVYEADRHASASLQNGAVAGDAVAELVSHAAELERRDQAVAHELEALTDVAERAGALRARAAEARSALERLPQELEDLARRTDAARADAEAAQEQLRLAEQRLEALEHARRRKREELDRAEREAATARELLADAQADVERLQANADELRSSERRLHDEGAELARAAAGIAGELARTPRVAGAAGLEPGDTLPELEEWGLLVRSAVLVARGTLESERERIVAEANALGSAALGEQLSATSVALVRRRLEHLTG
jgi:chromosome segregation ATPase